MFSKTLQMKPALTQDPLSSGSQAPPVCIGKGDGVLELLERACQRFKDQTAIEWGDKQVSYSALDDMANRVANCLAASQLSKGSLIATLVEDRIEIIATLIGILRAGCVFVPLAPEWPEERLSKIVADLSPDCFIIEASFSQLIPKIYGGDKKLCKILNISEKPNNLADSPIPPGASPADFSTENRLGSVDPEQMCYIYYTSGSTGIPKGIAGRIKGISHFIRWEIQTFNIPTGWRFSQFTQPTFDAFLRDVFVPLCSGGTVCIPPEKPANMGVTLLLDWIDSKKINLIHCVPSLFGAIAGGNLATEKFKSLEYILMAGESLPVPDLKKWRAVFGNRIKLVNLYGATETTMVKFYHLIDDSDLERGFIPIGKPMKGARAVVLDPHGNLCPQGVFGELYIRTPYQTIGYYKNPELTDKVFVKNPFSEDPNDLIYKTGDLARVLSDGNFQLGGRKDNQVKIRGIRVELGEIENQLRNHPRVKNAVVAAREDAAGNKRLVAYLVADLATDPVPLQISHLRSFLKEKLPDYMMPSAFVIMDALPLLSNGKVDRRALPAPDFERPDLEGSFVAPRDAVERQLAQIWEKLLGVKQIGIKDSYFDLGGHSLLAVALFAEIERAFGKNLPINVLLQAPTIEQLAVGLRQEEWSAPWSCLVPIQPAGSKPPLFCVHEADGHILCYRDLARHLGDDQPVYGLQPYGMDGKQPLYTRFEDMAAHFIKEIRSLQPQGPYLLGGLCAGGILAFEIAVQLQAQGQEVALVALFDAALDQAPALEIGDRLDRHLSKFVQMSPKEKLGYIFYKTQGKIQRTVRPLKEKIKLMNYKFYLDKGRFLPLFPAYIPVREVLNTYKYVPQVYSGRVTLFRAAEGTVEWHSDPAMGWGPLAAGGVEVCDVPGRHNEVTDMLTEPYVRVLAEKVRACIDRALGERVS